MHGHPGTRVAGAARGLHWRPGNFKLKPSSSTVARPAPHSGQSDGQWSSTGSLTVGAAACQSLSLRGGLAPCAADLASLAAHWQPGEGPGKSRPGLVTGRSDAKEFKF